MILRQILRHYFIVSHSYAHLVLLGSDVSRFCGKGCQNNCDAVKRPGGSGNSARARTIGYYESWSYARDCDSVAPEDIQASLWTHIK